MITLLTGLPGNGKGVYGLDWLEKKARLENRQVFYSGVNDCKIPNWMELEKPEDWWQCPAGSIILIDECQRIFRTRANGSLVPKHVSELETHRHNGLDLLLITQHPMLIDQNIRRLVGQHFHIVRKFGRQAAVVHEWSSVTEQPQKNRKDSIRHDYKYNKQVYNWYKSAEVHTVKRNVPKRYYFIFAAPFLIGGLVYYAYHVLNGRFIHRQPVTNATSLNGTSNTVSIEKPKDWFQQQVPRIVDLPQTAAKYDEVTKPTIAPLPVACIASKSKCACYTQQGTSYATSDSTCRQIVKNGFFQDFDSMGSKQTVARSHLNYPSHDSGGIGGGEAPPMAFAVPFNSVGLHSRSSPSNSL